MEPHSHTAHTISLLNKYDGASVLASRDWCGLSTPLTSFGSPCEEEGYELALLKVQQFSMLLLLFQCRYLEAQVGPDGMG